MANVEETVLTYWAACESRDWARMGALLADDVVYHLPQSRERIRGRDAYLQFNREYPGRWRFSVTRVTGAGARVASWITATSDAEELPAVTFFDLDEAGLISVITEFWPEPYEPPPGREHLVERYPAATARSA
ncbi:nuclear transport factor 2 family protein [Micromonospora musae]|uniref:Nuclear transport factor 2 family protein n=1 Tax=Micromonospora musae TaxID=1894970 RepID=A0A3A9YLD1_9ACTN|nr:nuclear transport factor 2 family protein [Micromonospora musae]RKN14391.1 nuclear transport factor 2 family protein [Micromonospora musae]RKN34866.1 nuclear transport factor 2 family protein [Micromonospora musae]